MRITACSIVKNEELNIARSIESYRDVVDEIIIIDTGSTDNTVEICKAHGARVLFFKWCNDFSAAKNYALEHAKGDWLIFLDADEWFVPNIKRSYFLNVLKKIDPRENAVLTSMCDVDPKSTKVRIKSVTCRIFRCSPNIRYHGSIHEKLLNSGKKMTYHKRLDIEIFHSGYAGEQIEYKSKRNLEVLYDVYIKGKADTEIYFYIFRENYNLGNTDEAVKFFNIFMEQKDSDAKIKGTDNMICIYENMYNIMIKNQDRFSQQERDNLLETAYNKYPKLPIHSYLIGIEKFKSREYMESDKWITKAIELNKNFKEPYTNIFFAFLVDAYCKLATISEIQYRRDDILTYYMKASQVANNNELILILSRIIDIIKIQSEEEIILFLNSILDLNKKENVESLLNVLKSTRLHKVFVYYAIRYNREFDGQNETTYIAMMLSGQIDLAVETAIESNRNYKCESDMDLQEDKPCIAEICNGKIKKNEILTTNGYTTVEYKDVAFGEACVREKVHGNWHLDYAVVGILYKKSIELYQKNKQYFNQEQSEIIEAYLKDNIISNATEDLINEHGKIYRNLFYISEKGDIDKFRNIII